MSPGRHTTELGGMRSAFLLTPALSAVKRGGTCLSSWPPSPTAPNAGLFRGMRLSRQPRGGHSRVTHSRNPADTGGHERIWRGRRLSIGGHWRSRWDTEGHDIRPVRDREAPGSNPGPPTNPYARVERNALTLVVCGSSSSCLYRDDSTAISAILPATLL